MTDPIERQTLPMPDRAFGESVPFDVRDVEGGFPSITPFASSGRLAERAGGAAR